MVAVVVLFACVLSGLAWAARRLRRRGGGGSLMNPFDEIWHPVAHQARIEAEAADERPAPSPLPGDRLVRGPLPERDTGTPPQG